MRPSRRTEKTGAGFRLLLDVAGRAAAAHVQQPRQAALDAERYAALVAGLTAALLRDNDTEGLRRVFTAVAEAFPRPTRVVDIGEWRARRGSRNLPSKQRKGK